jgi:metallo-beta-lactamase family protein
VSGVVRPLLTFLGAVGTVTGSRFLVEAAGARVLVDAGLYQGPSALRRRNWDEFPVDPASIDEVVLSHAHLDHTGYLPRLVREGFHGPVRCTAETAELVAIVLRDSAHLQEEDATYANRTGFSKHRPALPLYDAADVERTLPLLEPVGLDEDVPIVGGITLRLRPAGHILGSATVSLVVEGHRVLFSGDLGRRHHPLLRPPADPPASDTIVVESTYGDRLHPLPDPQRLAETVRRTIARGGSVLVPAFAVDRTELVLMALRRLTEAGEVPRVPVHVDSPMALAALRVYERAIAEGSPQVREDVARTSGLLDPGDLHAARTPAESRVLNAPRRPCIIISASGMATGGRIIHHLEHLLPDRRHTVVLTGYQAVGTRGRQLLEGARDVKIHGRYVPVRAEVVSIDDFSVHADAEEVLDWLARAPEPPGTAYVVHGEPESAQALVGRIRDDLGWNAVVPRYGERVLLD